MHTFTLTTPARNAILAGLRLLQAYPDQRLDPEDIQNIETDGGSHEPLAGGDIDELCERLNEADAIGGECIDAKLYLSAMGKLVRVVAMFPIADQTDATAAELANDYMAANEGVGVLATVNGMVLLAAISDNGTKPEKLGGTSETMPAPEAAAPTAAVQMSVELDPDFIDSVLIGMTEQGYPWFDWTDIEQTTFVRDGKTVACMSAAVATEFDPDEGVPADDAEPVRVDGPAIAAAIARLLSEPDLVGAFIRDDLARAVCERDAGHIDVNVADCIAQIAVLGEIRYG